MTRAEGATVFTAGRNEVTTADATRLQRLTANTLRSHGFCTGNVRYRYTYVYYVLFHDILLPPISQCLQ